MFEKFDANIMKALIQLDHIVENDNQTKKEMQIRALRAIHMIYRSHPEFKPKIEGIFTTALEMQERGA